MRIALVLALTGCTTSAATFDQFSSQQAQIVCDARTRCGCGDACGYTTPGSSRTYDSTTAATCLTGLRGGLTDCDAGAGSLSGVLALCAAASYGPDGGVHSIDAGTIREEVCAQAPLY